jgi:hypothetical protein
VLSNKYSRRIVSQRLLLGIELKWHSNVLACRRVVNQRR